MRQGISIAVVMAGLAVAVAGCGGGGSALSKTEFISKADAVCVQTRADRKALTSPPGNPTSPSISEADLKKWADPLHKVASSYHDEASKLGDLTPPSDFQDKWKSAVGLVNEGANEIDQAGDAAGSADRAKTVAKISESQDHFRQATSAIAGYGLQSCGG